MISKVLVVRAYHGKLEELARLGLELHLVVPTSYRSFIIGYHEKN